MNASWRFARCANAIKGDLVRQGALAPAHIRGKNRFPRSTLVSPTRLADRASNRGSITLDALQVSIKDAHLDNSVVGRQHENWSMTQMVRSLRSKLLYRQLNSYSAAQKKGALMPSIVGSILVFFFTLAPR